MYSAVGPQLQRVRLHNSEQCVDADRICRALEHPRTSRVKKDFKLKASAITPSAVLRVQLDELPQFLTCSGTMSGVG